MTYYTYLILLQHFPDRITSQSTAMSNATLTSSSGVKLQENKTKPSVTSPLTINTTLSGPTSVKTTNTLWLVTMK